MDCRLVGCWRIVAADLWDRDYLDLVAAATMTLGADGHGEIAYGAMQASLELEYSRSMVFFTWAGFDEGDEITGTGSAELNDDGTLEIAFAYHLGQITTADSKSRHRRTDHPLFFQPASAVTQS